MFSGSLQIESVVRVEEVMPSECTVWRRIACVLDAFGLMKLIGAAVVFVLFDGSPLFALGIVFAAPVIAACGALTARLLRQAATGRRMDYRSSRASQRCHREPFVGLFSTREQPRQRTFADVYTDVTPIKYRPVRTSARRPA